MYKEKDLVLRATKWINDSNNKRLRGFAAIALKKSGYPIIKVQHHCEYSSTTASVYNEIYSSYPKSKESWSYIEETFCHASLDEKKDKITINNGIKVNNLYAIHTNKNSKRIKYKFEIDEQDYTIRKIYDNGEAEEEILPLQIKQKALETFNKEVALYYIQKWREDFKPATFYLLDANNNCICKKREP